MLFTLKPGLLEIEKEIKIDIKKLKSGTTISWRRTVIKT